ncbi:hypothetical protein HDV02_003243 [Globomyces sp. JEL0801]|nr:hypothetical protein HDV02_003243 [Globomyces sp. JEL0801]
MTTERPYDVIIWGATGFTGELVAQYFTQHSPKDVKFAIAGRSEKKLNEVADKLKEMDEMLRFAGGPVPFIIADVDSCVRQKTDYVDLTGEPQFVRRCIDNYHEKATANNVLIVNSVGFDSIPSDLGSFLIANHFKSKGLKTDNIRYTVTEAVGGASGGTLASGINVIEELSYSELSELSSNPDYLIPNSIPSPTTWNSTRLYYDKGLKVWQFPFIMEICNLRYVRRSNYLLNYGPNFQYCEGMTSNYFAIAATAAVGIAVGGIAMMFPPVRWAAKAILPPGTGPSEKSRNEGHFTITLFGEATDDSGKKHYAKAVVKGVGDPGYKETSKMMSESALCLALNRLECGQPGKTGNFKSYTGGVVTSAASMGMVLIQRLRNAGMTFEVSETTL